MKKILFPLAAVALAAPGYAQNPRTPAQLDVGLGDSQAPSIATDGEMTVATWKDNVTEFMYASVSTDRGLTWGAATRIDDSPGGNKFAEDIGTRISGGNIYVSWRDERNSTEDDLYFTVSTDGGATWSADAMIDKGYPSGANPVRDWRMAADGNNVAIAVTPDNGNEDLFLVFSADGGATWSSAIAATSHNGHSDADAMAIEVQGDTAYLAWIDNFDLVAGTGSRTADACYMSTFDFVSGTFTAMDTLMNPNIEAAAGDLDDDMHMSVNGSTIAMTFQMDGASSRHETFASVSTDGGTTWSGDLKVDGATPLVDDCDNGKILVTDNGDVHVIWEDNRTGADEVYSAMSTDGGFTYTEHATSHGAGGFPEISGNGDYIGINFTGTAFPEGSQLAVSRDGGMTYAAVVDVAVGQIGDADFAEFAFNDLYQNFMCVWLSDDLGANQAYAGGMRNQTLTANGPFAAGNPINFDGSGFGASESGNEFMVLCSTAMGVANIPGDGRDVGLQVNPVLLQAAASPALKGTMGAGGTASTPVVSFPASFAPGTTLYFVGMSRSGGTYGSITDLVEVVVL